jgi:nucleotide-binding universal stress UspA family protein
MTIQHSKILIAVDDSQPAAWALDVGAALAERTGGAVTLVHVMPPPRAGMAEGVVMITEDEIGRLRAEGSAVLDAAAARLPAGTPVRTVLRQGPAGMEIVDEARAAGADFIVMGSRGRGRLSHFVLGSAAEAVIREAPCPVVTVSHDPGFTAVGTRAVGAGQRREAVTSV